MNRFLFVSLFLLLCFYVACLNALFETALIVFAFVIITAAVAVIYELDNKKRRAHLRVVK